jgi:hypothetical protein
MTSIDNEILERLQSCETDLQAHRGYMKSLEYGLRAAILTHPAPSALANAWNAMLPGIAEAHSDSEGLAYTAALQQGLALLTEQIEERCAKG